MPIKSIWRELGLDVDKYIHQLMRYLKKDYQQQQSQKQIDFTAKQYHHNQYKQLNNYIQARLLSTQSKIEQIFHEFEQQLRYKLSAFIFQFQVHKASEEHLKVEINQMKNWAYTQIHKKQSYIQNLKNKMDELSSLVKTYEKALINQNKNRDYHQFTQISPARLMLSPKMQQISTQKQNKLTFQNLFSFSILNQPTQIDKHSHRQKNHLQNSPISTSTLGRSRFTHHQPQKRQILKEKQMNWNNSINLDSKNVKCRNSKHNQHQNQLVNSRMTASRMSMTDKKPQFTPVNKQKLLKHTFLNSTKTPKQQSQLSRSFCM